MDHTELPATRHKWTHPALTPDPVSLYLIYLPRGMEGSADIGYSAMQRRESNSQPLDH